MDRKNKTYIRSPKTSTPLNIHKKSSKGFTKLLTDSPIHTIQTGNTQTSPIHATQTDRTETDKDSFIRSLHLITSDGSASTDEEKRDYGSGLGIQDDGEVKDYMSKDVSIALEHNVGIDEYYCKNPWNNTPVHAQGGKVSKSNIHKIIGQNKRTNNTSGVKKVTSNASSCEVESRKSKSHDQQSLIDQHVWEVIESVCQYHLHDVSTTTSRKSQAVGIKSKLSQNRNMQNNRKTTRKVKDLKDEVKNELTEDSHSDVEIITVSKDDVTFSSKKNKSKNQQKDQQSESLTGSDKKRKTLYSFKEKYSDESSVNDQSGKSLSENVTRTWEEIGANLTEIGESIGLNVNEDKGRDKSRNKKKSTNRSLKKKKENNLEQKSVTNLDITANSISDCSNKISDESFGGSTVEQKKSLIGRSSSLGKTNSSKKRLSEILPIPRKGKVKRKIISDSEDENDYGSEESNKRQKQEVELREITTSQTESSCFDRKDESSTYRQQIENRVKNIGKLKNVNDSHFENSLGTGTTTLRKSKRKSYIRNYNEDEVIDVDASETDLSVNVDLENSYSNVDEIQDSEEDSNINCSNIEETEMGRSHSNIEETETGRSRRSRRGNPSLNDYVQPKKKTKAKRGRKKQTVLKIEPGLENNEVKYEKRGYGENVHKTKSQFIHENHICLRCEMIFKNIYYLKHHLMSVHNALWNKNCPEGATDEQSLALILKRIGKLSCPRCGKELKYMHYYRKHVKWCGRENERYFCNLCEKYIMVMWEHEHNLMHLRKDKMEELDKEYAAAQAEKEITEGEYVDGKRSAAKKAVKLLQAINKSYDGVIDITSDDKDPDAEVLSETSDDDDVIFGDFIDEDELEDIKVAKDSRQMYTGTHFANTFYKNLEYNKEMDRYNNVQFPQFCPRVPQWDPLGDSESKDYLPTEETSPTFCIINNQKQTQNLRQLKTFEAFSSKDYAYLFAGGPIWGLAWCPHPQHQRKQNQYLAVSCHPDMDTLHEVGEAKEGPGLIQIWNIGKLNQSIQSMPTPTLELCIAHDYDVVRRMVWCPFKCWQSKDDSVEEDRIRQLGLLALACGDGSIRIFSIPDPEHLKDNNNSSTRIYRPSPEFTLVGHKIRRGKTSSCTSVAWSPTESNYLLGGYGDGSVRIWDLSTSSTLLRIPTPDQGLLLLPFRTFVPHSKTVTDLSWSPHSSQYFITSSIDRMAKVWSLDNLVMPQFMSKSSALTAAKWPTIVQSVVYSDDDVYVQQKGHIRLQTYGDLKDKNRGINCPLLGSTTGIWDVSISDWHLMIFSCDFNGNLTATYYPAVFGEKKPHRSKLLLYKVCLKTKISQEQNDEQGSSNIQNSQEVAENCSHGNHDTTQTYTDTVNKYYLEYIEQPCMDKKIVFADRLNLTQFPLTSIYRVEVNPNLESCMFVASGGQAGIVQIHNVTKYLSFHVAKDLRQELRVNS